MAATGRSDTLALLFQEILTAVVRLRSGRQAVSDAESFRQQVKDALRAAAQQARDQGGYSSADIRTGTFAVVGFLDETVLNSGLVVFSDWPRKPMQEELFGTHVAGEVFFQNLQELLARPDSLETADVLEVYQLCLLLGFRGRYSAGNQGDLHGLLGAIKDKIQRIRGVPQAEFAIGLEEPARRAGDPWLRRLAIAAMICVLLASCSFAAFRLSLGQTVAEVQAVASESAK